MLMRRGLEKYDGQGRSHVETSHSCFVDTTGRVTLAGARPGLSDHRTSMAPAAFRVWPKDGSTLALTQAQLDALVLGLASEALRQNEILAPTRARRPSEGAPTYHRFSRSARLSIAPVSLICSPRA